MSRPNYLNVKTAIVGIQGCYNFYIIKLDNCHNENTHEIVFESILCLFVCLFVSLFHGVLNNNSVLIFSFFFRILLYLYVDTFTINLLGEFVNSRVSHKAEHS